MASGPALTPTAGPGEILPLTGLRFPDKVALICGDVRLTYRQLDEASGALAVSLRSRGIQPGDVVSLYGQNSWQWIVSYHAALRAGAVVNPVNVMLTQAELQYVLADCKAKALFVGAEQLPTAMAAVESSDAGVELVVTAAQTASRGAHTLTKLVDEGADAETLFALPGPTELCSIAYTSGTTGHPKGAMQSHQSVLLNCALTATMHGRSSDDVMVTALPAAHVYGNVAINSIFLVGGTVVLMERFDAEIALALIESERATMFEGVPAMYSMMLAHPGFPAATLDSLRCSTVGGQTIATHVMQRWQDRTGAPLLELWGMTEMAGLGSTHAFHAPTVPGSIGVSLPGVQLRVASLDGGDREIPVGEPGELQARGPLVMMGYYGRPDATDEAVRSDGWLRTGDVAYVDDSGHFFVVDRLKDMIITGGYNIYPAEIERVIAAHPDVAMVAVGRRPDETRGEVAVAFVVIRDGATLTEEHVLEFCSRDLAAYKRPRAVVFTDALPMTSSGKIMRRKLTELDKSPVPTDATL
ncbi:MAG: AMP-binding protein [Mycobacterium sp.]|nr:AMP-binding protein [Mycobacterium sp.]